MLKIDIKHMEKTKLMILLVPAILFSLIYIALSLVNVPAQSSYFQLITFTFAGAENGHYPNGDKFRLEDVVSDSVVLSAVQKLNLREKYGDLDGIENSIAIYPYYSERLDIIEKYESVLDDKNNTIIDIDDARTSLVQQLETSTKVTAKLKFYGGAYGLSSNDAENLLQTVVAVWSDQATYSRGVVDRGASVLSPKVIEASVPDNTLESLRATWSEYEKIARQAALLKSRPESAGATDEVTGLSLEDLQSLLNDLEQKIVNAPVLWSTQPDNLLKLNQKLYSPELFNADLVGDMDYLIMMDVLADRVGLVKQNVSDLMNTPFGKTVTDPKTGMTLDDLDRLLDDILAYDIGQLRVPLLQLGISKNSDKVPLYYQMRIRELENDKKALLSKVEAIQGAESRYSRSKGDQSSSMAGEGALGAQFLDKIVSMGAKQSDTDYRQSLSYDTIALERQAIQLNKEIQRIQGFLETFANSAKNNSQTNLKQSYIKTIDQEVPKIFARLEGYASVTQRISNRLRYATDIRTVFSASPYVLSVDAYLQGGANDADEKNLAPIKQKLIEYSNTLSRLSDGLNEERYGVVNSLYRSIGEPTPVLEPYLSKRKLFVLILSNVSIFSFCLFLVIVLTLVDRREGPKRAVLQAKRNENENFYSHAQLTSP